MFLMCLSLLCTLVPYVQGAAFLLRAEQYNSDGFSTAKQFDTSTKSYQDDFELNGVTKYGDCSYRGDTYAEGSQVSTDEPCLSCNCTHGTLLCYLRVCPELPFPPPLGCVILHKHKTCCPELICNDLPNGGNRLDQRRNIPEIPDLLYTESSYGNGCIHNGSIYAEGSAMATSKNCNYCYCLRARMQCVRPRCVAPADGCVAVHSPHTCCPVRYICGDSNETALAEIQTEVSSTTVSTTSSTVPPWVSMIRGCTVEGEHFLEGERVLLPSHSACDVCYCLRGAVRCDEMHCAPALHGCAPVIPPGACCAASYNCGGAIKVDPNGHYGFTPIISDTYAKLRKETFDPSNKLWDNTIGTNRQFPEHATIIITKKSNTKTDSIPNKTAIKWSDSKIFSPENEKLDDDEQLEDIDVAETDNLSKLTTKSYFNDDLEFFSEQTPEKPSISSLQISSLKLEEPNRNLTKDDSNNNKEQTTETESINTSTTDSETDFTTKYMTDITTIEYSTEVGNFTTIGEELTTMTNENSTPTQTEFENVTEIITVENCTGGNVSNVTAGNGNDIKINSQILQDTNVTNSFSKVNITDQMKNNGNIGIKGNGTDVVNSTKDNSKIEERISDGIDAVLSEKFNNTLNVSKNEFLEMEKNNKTNNSSTENLLSDLEDILSIPKFKDPDYDFDYNFPTLPPSLPNVRIIPFVAADAVDEEKEFSTSAPFGPFPSLTQESLHSTENPIFNYDSQTLNLFSPPNKTEGGFVPKEPSILDTYYEPGFLTTAGLLDRSSVPAITNPPKTNEDNCIWKGREYRHGEVLSEPDACVLCICFFGDEVCQPPKCPPVKPGCRHVPSDDPIVCCGNVVCEDSDTPTVVLDRIDVSPIPQDIITVADGISTPDPFKDVIRTEPAPDLQSLIGDMMPFLKKLTNSPTTMKNLPFITVANESQTPPSTGSSITLHETPSTLPTSTMRHPSYEPTTVEPSELENKQDEDSFSFDKVLEFLFSGETTTNKKVGTVSSTTTTTPKYEVESRIVNNVPNQNYNYIPLNKNKYVPKFNKTRIPGNKRRTTTVKTPTTTEITRRSSAATSTEKEEGNSHRNNVESSPGIGTLKVAGCNIYGRMYRVDRIITELSGPCLECMCTDLGVQCKPLKC